MSALHPWEEVHSPTDDDYQAAADWGEAYEDTDRLRAAIRTTELATCCEIEISERTAEYHGRNDEMRAYTTLSFTLDRPLHSEVDVSDRHIANVFSVLAVELVGPVEKGNGMFSVRQKREIADKVQQILRDTAHPELPEGEIPFALQVVGSTGMSCADIRNNGAVTEPGVNHWNEQQDTELRKEL